MQNFEECIFHDYVKLNLTFPLISESDQFEFTGIGAFKSSNSFTISGGDCVKVNIHSLQFDRQGLMTKTVHGLHDTRLIKNELVEIQTTEVELQRLDTEIANLPLDIQDKIIKTTMTGFEIINLSEDELIVELNK